MSLVFTKAVVFTEESPGLWDLTIDGRTGEYEIERDDLEGALRRRRIPEGAEILLIPLDYPRVRQEYRRGRV